MFRVFLHQCLARFAAKETLNRHVRTHTGDKPHACKICGKSFIQAAQLRSHLFHHTGNFYFMLSSPPKSGVKVDKIIGKGLVRCVRDEF